MTPRYRHLNQRQGRSLAKMGALALLVPSVLAFTPGAAIADDETPPPTACTTDPPDPDSETDVHSCADAAPAPSATQEETDDPVEQAETPSKSSEVSDDRPNDEGDGNEVVGDNEPASGGSGGVGERRGDGGVGVLSVPAAVDDVATTAEDTTIAIDVYANDTVPLAVSQVEVDWPAHGRTSWSGVGEVFYTPDRNWHGTETFR
ncbi:MAG: Ig-like domain-containing protein, partial [Nocardioidaceae bacterium]|nr:Ig-like domain-containing protein [Nocardioidaceae bacterium]